jgi:hypothetical protein
MVLENVSEILNAISPQLAESFSKLFTVLKVVGIAFIIYIIYLVVNFILSVKKERKLKRIEIKVNSIEKKLDLILKNKKQKRH